MAILKNYMEGGDAWALLHEILDSVTPDGKYTLHTTEPKCKGYFKEDGKIVAYDNSDGNCWVEEFEHKGDALRWLAN